MERGELERSDSIIVIIVIVVVIIIVLGVVVDIRHVQSRESVSVSIYVCCASHAVYVRTYI